MVGLANQGDQQQAQEEEQEDKVHTDLLHGENIVRTLRDFHLRFDDFTYGNLNERVKQVVEAFKLENSVPLVIPKPKNTRKISQSLETERGNLTA